MEKALSYYKIFTDLLMKSILVCAGILMAFDIVCIFIEVVSRLVFGSSMAQLEELPRLFIPFIVFPMMGVLLKLKKHVSVDILPEALEGKNRSILMIIVYSAVLAISIVFFLAGIFTVQYYYEMNFEIQTEIIFKCWIIYMAFPVGFGLLILFAVEMVWEEVVLLVRQINEERI